MLINTREDLIYEVMHLEIGKLADIMILDVDLLNCTEENIKETIVQKTLVGGDIVYSNN